MVSHNLKKLRAEKGMTQKQLAKISKVSEQQISGYEKGLRQPNASVLKRLAVALNISISELEGTVQPPTKTESADLPEKAHLIKLFNSFMAEQVPKGDISTITNIIEAFSLKNRVKKLTTSE